MFQVCRFNRSGLQRSVRCFLLYFYRLVFRITDPIAKIRAIDFSITELYFSLVGATDDIRNVLRIAQPFPYTGGYSAG